jgi:hypothetical protein
MVDLSRLSFCSGIFTGQKLDSLLHADHGAAFAVSIFSFVILAQSHAFACGSSAATRLAAQRANRSGLRYLRFLL